MRYSPLNLH